MTSTHNGNFDCLNCLRLFKTKSKLESDKKVPENEDFCCKGMCSSNQYLKFSR